MRFFKSLSSSMVPVASWEEPCGIRPDRAQEVVGGTGSGRMGNGTFPIWRFRMQDNETIIGNIGLPQLDAFQGTQSPVEHERHGTLQRFWSDLQIGCLQFRRDNEFTTG